MPPTANAEGTKKNENTLAIIPTVATPTLFGWEHAFFDVTTDKPSQNSKWTLAKYFGNADTREHRRQYRVEQDSF